MTFDSRTGTIVVSQLSPPTSDGEVINVSLTLRNWVIGYYILEYEQRGADRADYGGHLLGNSGVSDSRIRTCGHDPCHISLVYSFERAHCNRRPAQARVLRGRVHARQLVGAGAQAARGRSRPKVTRITTPRSHLIFLKRARVLSAAVEYYLWHERTCSTLGCAESTHTGVPVLWWLYDHRRRHLRN